ncbi:hypothetical protein FRC00_001756, partial [Tulasnella sp. 408]
RTADEFSATDAQINDAVRESLGSRWIVCGYPAFVQVAHIIARDESFKANRNLEGLRDWSPQLATFHKNQTENLLVLCPNYHREYYDGMIAIVPTPPALDSPVGLKLSQQVLTPLLNVLNVTDSPYIATSYVFDSIGSTNYCNNSLSVFLYPLLVAAYPPLMMSYILRRRSDQVDKAQAEVRELVDLYNRTIALSNPVPDWVLAAAAELAKLPIPRDPRLNQSGNMSMMPAISEAFHSGAVATNGSIAIQDLGPGSPIQAPTDGSEGSMRDDNPWQLDLLDYDDDPIIAFAPLANRPLWSDEPRRFDSMLFATPADFGNKPEDD